MLDHLTAEWVVWTGVCGVDLAVFMS